MRARVLLAIAVIQILFLAASVALYEQFYLEVGRAAGVILLTPAIGVVGGGLLAYGLGTRDRSRRFTIWAACILAAYPCYFISRPVGDSLGYQVYTARLNRALHQNTRAVHEWAARGGWEIWDSNIGPERFAYVILRRDGEFYLTLLELGPAPRARGLLQYSVVNRELSRVLGGPATLVYLDASKQPQVRTASNARLFSANLIPPDADAGGWRLLCPACPVAVDVTLPGAD